MFTRQEVATLFAVSLRTVSIWVQSGVLHALPAEQPRVRQQFAASEIWALLPEKLHERAFILLRPWDAHRLYGPSRKTLREWTSDGILTRVILPESGRVMHRYIESELAQAMKLPLSDHARKLWSDDIAQLLGISVDSAVKLLQSGEIRSSSTDLDPTAYRATSRDVRAYLVSLLYI